MPGYIVAVSGGVDSVALLDMMTKAGTSPLVVAHVDHGIREDSAEDAAFVESLAHQYGLPFRLIQHELGPDASEDVARTVRYAFLRSLAEEYGARIVTAHHRDDVVETIAINLHRGTGWRGVATHGADVARPLLSYSKQQLTQYAKNNNLEWREDSTNQSDKYLRNRIRRHVETLPESTKQRLLDLREKQHVYRNRIDEEVAAIIGDGPHYSRYFFTHIPTSVARECLRRITEGRLTRPQMDRLHHDIKVAKPGTSTHPGTGVSVGFTTRNFTVTLVR